MNIYKYLFIIFLIIIFSCDSSFRYKENIIGNYYLVALELNEDMSLSYKVNEEDDAFVGIVNPTVFALGYNKDYIIVKQHPEKKPFVPDKTITNYFIVPLNNKVSKSVEKNIIGPLSNEEFKNKRKELGVSSDLTFTRIFKNLM